MEKIGTQVYRLKLPDMWRIHPMFHVSLLKQWRESLVQQVLGEVELEDADRPEYFEVEKTLRWRWSSKTQRQRREFLVLWQGYPMRRKQSGSPHLISVTKMHSRTTFRPTRFPKSNETSSAFCGQKLLHGGE